MLDRKRILFGCDDSRIHLGQRDSLYHQNYHLSHRYNVLLTQNLLSQTKTKHTKVITHEDVGVLEEKQLAKSLFIWMIHMAKK